MALVPERIQKHSNAQQRERHRVVEQVLLRHPEQRRAGQLRDPGPQQRQKRQQEQQSPRADKEPHARGDIHGVLQS